MRVLCEFLSASLFTLVKKALIEIVSECLRKSVLVFRRLSRRDDHYTWAWNSLGRYSSRPALFDRRC